MSFSKILASLISSSGYISKYFCGAMSGVCGLTNPTAKKKGESLSDLANSLILSSAHCALISSGVKSLSSSLTYLNSLYPLEPP